MKKGMRTLVFDQDKKNIGSCKLIKKLWSRIKTDTAGTKWRVEKWIVRMECNHLITTKITVECFDVRLPEMEQVAV